MREARGSGEAPIVVYASSAAVLGPAGDYSELPVPDDVYHKPRTLYGIYKLCNEGCARIYFQVREGEKGEKKTEEEKKKSTEKRVEIFFGRVDQNITFEEIKGGM